MPITAILMVVAGVTMFAAMDAIGKSLAGDCTVAQLVWARYAFAVPVVLAAARPRDWPRLLSGPSRGLQVLRGLLPVVASGSVILGVSRMPLADFTAISFVAPLAVVALSAILLGEKVSRRSWIGVATGFAGVLLIARPGTGVLAAAAVFPLATALLFALYQVLTRKLAHAVSPQTMIGWTIAVGLVASTAALPFDWAPVDAADWPPLVATGLLFGSAHLLLIRAFALASAASLAPFTYVQIVVSILLGLMFFAETPDLLAVVGTLVVAGSGLYVSRSARPGP